MRKLTPGQMVSLPWRWRGPTSERDHQGNEWWELRIEELPEFFVASPSREGAIAEAGAALEAFLGSYDSRSELPPLPRVFGTWKEVPEGYDTVQFRDLQVA